MTLTILCKNCGKRKPANPHLKGTSQYYCGDPDCQRARKRNWHKNKMKADSRYLKKQLESKKNWRKKYPVDKYQREYRETHPEYVLRNRELQHIRNKKQAKLKKVAKIVKMDALKMPSEKISTYVMNSRKIDSDGKIVKMDTLIIQLADFQNDIDIFSSDWS